MHSRGPSHTVAVGALNDYFTGSLKTFILISYALASIFFAGFGLLILEYWIPPNGTLVSLLYTTAIGGGFFLYCPIPLFYEMVVEETYPHVAAATSSGVLSILVTVRCALAIQHGAKHASYTRVTNMMNLGSRTVCFVAGRANIVSLCTRREVDGLGDDAGHTSIDGSDAATVYQVPKDARGPGG